MKTTLLFLILLAFNFISNAQTGIVFNGMAIPPNAASWSWGQSTLEIETGAGPETGTNALKWVQGDEWGGGWTGIGFTIDPPFDLSAVWESESATFKLKCDEGVGPLRIQYESNNSAGKIGTVFTPITDNQWHEYTFPLHDMVFQDGATEFNPASVNTVGLMAEASGIVGKIIYITDWHITTKPSLILFNGVAYPSTIESWIWGSSTIEVAEGAGPVPGSNAVKWTQGDGEMGFGLTVNPPYDLSEVWSTDSLKFKLKADEGTDSITIMFYNSATNVLVGTNLAPIADNQWHNYALPLRDMLPLRGSSGFNPADIAYVEVQSGQFTGHGIAGKVLYFTDWWTGNPVFDVLAPLAPEGLAVSTDNFKNVITWTDVAGENSERYNIYYSKNPITDISRADVVKLKIAEGTQTADHDLRAPNSDQPVTYYYAITCTDAAGNTSLPFSSTIAVTNTAKGVATISINPPVTFAADGDLSEWAGITPIHMAPSGGGYTVSWGEPFDNDADLTMDVYMAVDNTYLYIAFDAEDDVVNLSDPSTNQQDSPDLHIGLYNWRGPSHTSYKRGKEPDYLIRFASSRVLVDLVNSGDSLLLPGDNYFWGEKFPTGYSIEARIPWAALAAKTGDSVFVPMEGYRIPLDFLINDADADGFRESMLAYSPTNDGNSWSDVSLWSYTWIGGTMEPVGINDKNNLVNSYSLSQNYPNPFNPTTQIKYNLEKPGLVTLKIYDLLGRLVTTLVNQQQEAGVHTFNFNASSLTSGVYFYQVNSGSFSDVKKMMLIK